MKYPRKYKEEEVFILVPFETRKNIWRPASLSKNGILKVDGSADHHTPESCQICCSAHNRRVGYDDIKVKKIIKHYSNEQEEGRGAEKGKEPKKSKAAKRVKKGKKGKKGKKTKNNKN